MEENDIELSAAVEDTVNEISSSMDNLLSDEEKENVTDTDPIDGEDDWESVELTEQEIEQSNALQAGLSDFLREKIDLTVGTGVVKTLTTGIDLLDAIMGGGPGVGTVTMFVGPPGTFKSGITGQTIGASQKKFRGKLLAAYHDSENATTINRLMSLGVEYPPITPYDDVTIESVFKSIEAICGFKQLHDIVDIPSIVAWDSVANTSTELALSTDNMDPNKVTGLNARLLSFIFPRYVPKMKRNNVSLIIVNQLRDKLDIGRFGTPNDLKYMGNKIMPGGQSLKFNAFHLIHLTQKAELKDKYEGLINGFELEAKCIKNKLFPPNIPVKLIAQFNKGISNFWTNFEFLVDNKRIKAGAWNHLLSLPDVKFQTARVEEFYKNNERGFKTAFDKEAKDCIQTEIIDKHKSK